MRRRYRRSSHTHSAGGEPLGKRQISSGLKQAAPGNRRSAPLRSFVRHLAAAPCDAPSNLSFVMPQLRARIERVPEAVPEEIKRQKGHAHGGGGEEQKPPVALDWVNDLRGIAQ